MHAPAGAVLKEKAYVTSFGMVTRRYRSLAGSAIYHSAVARRKAALLYIRFACDMFASQTSFVGEANRTPKE